MSASAGKVEVPAGHVAVAASTPYYLNSLNAPATPISVFTVGEADAMESKPLVVLNYMRSTAKIAAIFVLTTRFIFGNLSMVSGRVKTVLLTAAKVEKLL